MFTRENLQNEAYLKMSLCILRLGSVVLIDRLIFYHDAIKTGNGAAALKKSEDLYFWKSNSQHTSKDYHLFVYILYN